MKKYYIPTTTLNFNNILSSESISPSAFFQQRGFGYSRWFKLPENNQNNSIVLYDSLARFEREDSELEDHPMVIEIETQETFHEINNGIYTTDKTIYLNPWNTKFIFFHDQDKKVVLSLSDSSLETKMIPLYKKGFEVKTPQSKYVTLQEEIEYKLNASEINHDRVINRLKGLMYGYYIGASLSCDKSSVEQYSTLKELQNIFAAVLSSPLRKPTEQQEKRVHSLLCSVPFQHPLFREIESIVKNREDAIKVFNACKKYGLSIPNINPTSFFRELQVGDKENNRALQWVSDELKKLKTEAYANRKLLLPADNEIVVAENQLSSIKQSIIPNASENQLFVDLVNYVLKDEEINGKISSQRMELADKLTRTAKETMGEEWTSSPIRSYLNALRRHIGGEEFNQNWDNGVLSSLAVVLLKGDDWEDLLDFMKRKGMTDYRLAFAFYGAFNGFANLTRDFTNLLFSNESSYVADVYRFIHKSLHGTIPQSSPLVFEHRSPIEETYVESEFPYTMFQPQEVYNFYKTQVRKTKKNTQKQLNLEGELKFTLDLLGECRDPYIMVCVLNDCPTWGSGPEWKAIKDKFCPDYATIRDSKLSYDPNVGIPASPLLQSIWSYFLKELYPKAKVDTKFQMTAELKYVLNRIQNCVDQYIFVCVLNDSALWSSKSIEWQRMQQEFCPNYDTIRNIGEARIEVVKTSKRKVEIDSVGKAKGVNSFSDWDNVESGSLKKPNEIHYPTDPSSSSADAFIYDENCWNKIEHLIPDSIKIKVRERLEWFQGEFRKGSQSSYYSTYYKTENPDMDRVLCAFDRHLKNKLKAEDLRLLNMDRLMETLRNTYVR